MNNVPEFTNMASKPGASLNALDVLAPLKYKKSFAATDDEVPDTVTVLLATEMEVIVKSPLCWVSEAVWPVQHSRIQSLRPAAQIPVAQDALVSVITPEAMDDTFPIPR